MRNCGSWGICGIMRPCAGKVYFKMATLIGCQGCDLLVDVAGMPEGGRANCPRCGHFLTRYRSDAVTRALAYCFSAAIALVIANCFAFLTMGAAGLQTTMTLPETAIMLYRYGMPDLALLVGGFILVLPALALTLKNFSDLSRTISEKPNALVMPVEIPADPIPEARP